MSEDIRKEFKELADLATTINMWLEQGVLISENEFRMAFVALTQLQSFFYKISEEREIEETMH